MMWTESTTSAGTMWGRGSGFLVRKYGGTSVATVGHIRRVAESAVLAQRGGHRVLLVVSAMSGETNRLLALAHEVTPVPSLREADVVAATGEQISAGLMAIAIEAAGGKARSYLAHQLVLRTDSHHAEARLLDIETARLVADVREGVIPVVAGFQGVTRDGDITTLGRGGSDTTAVAVAAALREATGSAVCEIYTDVDGIYTADPAVIATARKLAGVSYRHMLELSTLGAKVLHPRSVSLARKYQVPVAVRTSLADRPGTWVTDELEGSHVTSLACDRNLARLVLGGVMAEEATERLAAGGIRFESAERVESGVSLFLRHGDVPRAVALLVPASYRSQGPLARVSLVGEMLQTDPSAAARLLRALRRSGVMALGLTAGEMSLSAVVTAQDADTALRALHDEFELGKETA